MPKKLLPVTAFCFMLAVCNNNDLQEIELIVVNKTPMGAYAAEESPNKFRGDGWYNIGLSRNGEEPLEYIWRTSKDPYSYSILNAEIGDKGTVRLRDWAKQSKIKLPRPNAEKPPVIGAFGEVRWNKNKDKNP